LCGTTGNQLFDYWGNSLCNVIYFLDGSLSNSMKVVILRDDLAELKMKLNCSQEQFVDLLQEYYTQQLIQPVLQPKLDQPAGEPPQDQDALPPWVMLRIRNELAEIHKNLSYHPVISQEQWVRALRTALDDAMQGGI